MILNYKILILYVLRNIEIIELKQIIWEKIFDEEEELMNQNWYEIDEIEKEMLKFNLSDIERTFIGTVKLWLQNLVEESIKTLRNNKKIDGEIATLFLTFSNIILTIYLYFYLLLLLNN